MKRLALLMGLIEELGLTAYARTSEYWATAEQILETGRDLAFEDYPESGTAYEHEVQLIATWLGDPRNWKLEDPSWMGLVEAWKPKNLAATGRTM